MLRERGFVESEEGFEHLDGVAGAALLGLEDELDAGVFDGSFYPVGFVADDAEDVVGGDDLLCGGDDVEEERAASDLVEDFGALAFKAGAFACGHDGDGEVWGVHTGIWSHGRGLWGMARRGQDRNRSVGTLLAIQSPYKVSYDWRRDPDLDLSPHFVRERLCGPCADESV